MGAQQPLEWIHDCGWWGPGEQSCRTARLLQRSSHPAQVLFWGLQQEPGSREIKPGLQLECHSATLWWFARPITGRKLIWGALKPRDRALDLADRRCDSSAQGWFLGILPVGLSASSAFLLHSTETRTRLWEVFISLWVTCSEVSRGECQEKQHKLRSLQFVLVFFFFFLEKNKFQYPVALVRLQM